VAHSNGCNFWCDIGESGGVLKWTTKMGNILGAILVNQVGYKWSTKMGEIFWAILVNQVG
jgi:hypothetical protein